MRRTTASIRIGSESRADRRAGICRSCRASSRRTPNEKSPDPIERVSSRVQAVACLFPPTDFLNYGEPGKIAWTTTLDLLPAPFEFEKTEQVLKAKPTSVHFVKVNTDEQKAIAKQMSPIYWVTSKAPPTLIIHGDADKLVPIEQSRRLIEKLDEAKVPAKLEVRKGKGHGWADADPDVKMMLEWFSEHLSKPNKEAPTKPKAAKQEAEAAGAK